MVGISQHNTSRATNLSNNIDSQESTNGFLAAAGMADKRLKQPWGRQNAPNAQSPGAARRQHAQPVENSSKAVTQANVSASPPLKLLKRAPGHFDSLRVPVPHSPLPRQSSSVQMPVHQMPRSVQQIPRSVQQHSSTHSRSKPPATPKDVEQLSNRADILSLGSVPLHSPNLVAFRTPRQNKNPEGSSTASLPSVSSIVTTAENVEHVTAENKLPADIRQKIGLHRSLDVDGDTWRAHKFLDYKFGEDSFLNPFIAAWRKDIPFNVRANFTTEKGSPDHAKCDIDTVTGRLLPPVDYPDAIPIIVDAKGGLDWRRQTWSSSLLAQRRKLIKIQKGISEYQEDLLNPEEVAEAAEAQRKANEKFMAGRPPYCVFSPRIPCYLRPAGPDDMEQVMAIYNWEVQNGLQALDSEPLDIIDFEKILSRTRGLRMPFLVAVYGAAKQLNTNKGNIFYTSVTRHPDATLPPNPKLVGNIVGFAYLSVWEPGLTGSGIGSSRATARVNLFTHSEYKRKRIGYSLLDKLLSTVSDRYSTTEGYDFVDVSDSPVYKGPKEHARKYYRVFSNYLVRHKYWDQDKPELKARQATYEDELKYIQKMLMEDFNFDLHGRFNMVHRTPKSRSGRVGWLDSVVFDHVCWMGLDDKFDIVRDDKY